MFILAFLRRNELFSLQSLYLKGLFFLKGGNINANNCENVPLIHALVNRALKTGDTDLLNVFLTLGSDAHTTQNVKMSAYDMAILACDQKEKYPYAYQALACLTNHTRLQSSPTLLDISFANR